MHIELDGAGPLHEQLTRALKTAILGRRLAAGTRLPATRELALELGMSRNTVLAAYEQLSAEGYLQSRTGSGSYVAALQLRDASSHTATTTGNRPPRLSRFGREAMRLRAHKPPGPKLRRGPLRYNLEYGLPLVSPALQSAWRRALSAAADDTDFDYPPAEGLPGLRAAIAAYLARRRGINADPDDILVVAGTQQALDLSVRVLVERGETAVLEEPSYQGARQALLAHGAKIAAVAVDDAGMMVERLPATGARLLVVTPSHQFPTGCVLSLPRRLNLLAWAARHGAWVVEDDYDGEYRYDARPIAALKALDRRDRVIYIGTFSKVLFPALRLGYLIAPPALREALRAAKWLCDRGCPAIEQRALAGLIVSGRFERLLRRSSRVLAGRRSALLNALARHCGERVVVEGASAGMHVSVRLPEFAASAVPAIIAAAERRGVGVYPISPYYVRAPRHAGLLLGYSGLSPTDLAEAARRLREALDEVAAR